MQKSKFVIWILLLIMLILSGCEVTEQQEVKSTLLNTVESSIVKQIKSLTTPEGILLGDLIEAGMGSCTYELYDPAEDGNTYVTISGNITYDGIPVVAKLQYKRISESEFEFYTLVYNDLPRTQLETAAFFEYLYDSYYETQSIEPSTEKVTTTESVQTTTESEAVESDDYSADTAIVDDLGLITSFIDIDSMVYEFGSRAEFKADFNGDFVEDTVIFYFEQMWFFITFIDGTGNEGYSTDVFVPESVLDDNGDVSIDFETLLSVADLDQNGDYEFLVSYTNFASISAMTIYDAFYNQLDYIGELEGQYEFVLFGDGEILAPIGTQGLGNFYQYSDGYLEKTN